MYRNLKLQIFRSGISQQEIARTVGIHTTTLSKIVNGVRKPQPALKQRLADVLQADAEWLFPTDDAR